MTVSLNGEVRARLDAHLDAVEQSLAASGSSREQRRGVVDDLESQILDMLAAKSESPTLADMDDVLAKLDPPAVYGVAPAANSAAGGTEPVAARPRLPVTLIVGMILVVLSLVPLLVFSALRLFVLPRPGDLFIDRDADFFLSHMMNVVTWCLLIGQSPLGIAGTVLGWVGLAHIKSSAGRLRGKGMALFAGLFYPSVIVLLVGMRLLSSLL